MLKLGNNVVINEAHIVTAKFENDSKILTLVFSVPVNFDQKTEGDSNQVQLSGNEAENLWRILSKDAQQVNPTPSGTTGSSQYRVGGQHPPLDLI